MTRQQKRDFAEWLSTRPASVQALGKKFPPGTRFKGHHNEILYLVGYKEDGGLLVSATDPARDHKKAEATKEVLCACCVKKFEESA